MAPRAAVLRMVLRETLSIAAWGVVVGLPLAWAGSRLMTGMLFGVSPDDPQTMALAASVIMAVALLSGAMPAIRASRVDPMTALRDEWPAPDPQIARSPDRKIARSQDRTIRLPSSLIYNLHVTGAFRRRARRCSCAAPRVCGRFSSRRRQSWSWAPRRAALASSRPTSS